MNESILKALMKLFALLANVDSKSRSYKERDIVREFLQQQFSNELVNTFLSYYDSNVTIYKDLQIEDLEKQPEERQKLIETRLKELCDQINEELQHEQKIILLVNLLDYINEDKNITPAENIFVDKAAEFLKLDKNEYLDLKNFTIDNINSIIQKENILFINSKKSIESIYKHIHNEKIEGEIRVLYIKIGNLFVFRYLGNEALFLNGHYIKPYRSYMLYPGSVIKNPKIGSIYYTWIAGKFIQAQIKTKFVFTATDIEFSYGNSPNGIKRFTLTEESGRLIGIIGSSGCGKSTLLKLLCGNLKPKRGKITINGFDIHEHKEALKGIIGYVPQDEVLIKELTVFENLYYNAKLCFGDYTEEQILKVVEESLINFDLYEARDLKVGDSFNTFLSGGQRKRLNIALELMREPAILFVDEPTSGLSSADSEKVMLMLKRQTFKGKLIFANLHQPSSDIFKLLDKLLVMDQGGRIIYYGNPIEAITYFKRLSNYVDAEESECLACGNINTDIILRIVEARVVDVNGRLTRKRKVSPEEWYQLYMQKIDPIIKNIKRPYEPELPQSDFKPPSRLQQIKIFLKRDLKAKLANKQYQLLTLTEAPILALILSFFAKSSKISFLKETKYIFGENPNIPPFLFMSVVVALFLGLIISAEEIFKDRKLLEREKFLNLSRFSYLSAKIFILFAISAIQMLSYILVSHTILEIKGMEFNYFVVLFTTACWANLIGLNISAGFNSVITIYILVPLLLVPQLLLSGTVIDFKDMNPVVKSEKYVPRIGDLITSRWSYEALAVTQFKDNKFEKYFYWEEFEQSNANYLKSYLIPYLQDINKECLMHIHKNRDNDSILKQNIKILKGELKKLFKISSPYKSIIDYVDDTSKTYKPEIYLDIENYLKKIHSIAIYKYRIASTAKDEKFELLIKKLGSKDKFVDFKQKYYNKKLASIVTNENELVQFYFNGEELIRTRDYIFRYPESNRGRAHFYAPVKIVGNLIIDTLWYNIALIWISIFFWFVILYFDLIKILINYFESIKLRRRSRRRFLNIINI